MKELQELIDAKIVVGEVDPKVISLSILPLLTASMQSEAMQIGLHYLARQRITALRRTAPDQLEEHEESTHVQPITTQDEYAEIVNDPLRWPYWVPRKGWLTLMECNAVDVYRIEQTYRTRARVNTRWARRMQALRERLNQAGVDKVGDLGVDIVREIFNRDFEEDQ